MLCSLTELTLRVVDIEDLLHWCYCAIFTVVTIISAFSSNIFSVSHKVWWCSIACVHSHVIESTLVQLNCRLGTDDVVKVGHETLHCHGTWQHFVVYVTIVFH
jgi:hypothetical protein